mmetsp:Transcript_26580/g.37441  ORF Transcript_26580/g.37441 Transcript_26580/m.37441 type:complete len:202 (-) Transcript_26580:59-664(-)
MMKQAILLCAVFATSVSAFAPPVAGGVKSSQLNLFGKAKGGSSASSKLADDALAVYDQTYTKRTGTGETFFDADDNTLKASFNILAKLYGEEAALGMVKNQPAILAYKSANFEPSLAEFGNIFGEEEAKGMVMRNPNLLSVSPTQAATSDNLTMQLSYVVSVTRPLGKFGLLALLALVLTPAIEGFTGIELPFHAMRTHTM